MSQLEEMAKNGYGHWLRKYIPQEELELDRWRSEILSLEKRARDLREMVKTREVSLLNNKASLNLINTKYADIEPPGESE